MRILVNLIDTVGVESTATANDPMHLIVFFEQQFR